MANYKVKWEGSTLGAPGTTVTEDDVVKAPADLDLLLEAGIIEPSTKTTSKE